MVIYEIICDGDCACCYIRTARDEKFIPNKTCSEWAFSYGIKVTIDENAESKYKKERDE